MPIVQDVELGDDDDNRFAMSQKRKQMASLSPEGLLTMEKKTGKPKDRRKYIDLALDENMLESYTKTVEIEGLDGKG